MQRNSIAAACLACGAERSAKQGKVGMWHNYVPQTGNSAKLR